jgi:hypothetical protein
MTSGTASVAEVMLREVLEALCEQRGIPLDSSADPGTPARNYELADRLGIGHVFGLGQAPGSPSGRPGVTRPVIGADLAEELNRYRGRWVAVINQHVVSAGDSPGEAAANVPGAVPGFKGSIDPLIFRVPKQALAAWLGIGQAASGEEVP